MSDAELAEEAAVLMDSIQPQFGVEIRRNLRLMDPTHQGHVIVTQRELTQLEAKFCVEGEENVHFNLSAKERKVVYALLYCAANQLVEAK